MYRIYTRSTRKQCTQCQQGLTGSEKMSKICKKSMHGHHFLDMEHDYTGCISVYKKIPKIHPVGWCDHIFSCIKLGACDAHEENIDYFCNLDFYK